MSIDFQHVGKVIICLTINATKAKPLGWEVRFMLFNANVIQVLK